MENKIFDLLTGAILGVLFGTFYYLVPAKLLITGPMEMDGIFLPEGLNTIIILESLRTGGVIGLIIGSIFGLAITNNFTRGQLSACISLICCFACIIAAFWVNGHNLREMTIWKILFTFLTVGVCFLISPIIGQMLSFIEKLRE